MRKLYVFATFLLMTLPVYAQLVTCRPRQCVVDYDAGHNDFANPINAAALKIISLQPDILIGGTPGGYWHSQIKPALYGVTRTYSYITGRNENTTAPTVPGDFTQGDSTANKARIAAIALDGAAGVFLDNVSHHPDAKGKLYIRAIFKACRSHNLKLILNTGVSSFDSWLMDYCDFIMTDEHYDGVRALSVSEAPYADRVLVVNEGVVKSAAEAKIINIGARANGFGYSYACFDYQALPTWLSTYNTVIANQAPATPMITKIGNILYSQAPVGNQWYKSGSGPIMAATNQSYTPNTSGSYYVIVKLDGCSSAASNSITTTVLATTAPTSNQAFQLYPNPAAEMVTITFDNAPGGRVEVTISDLMGRNVKFEQLNQADPQINVGSLSNGLYLVTCKANGSIAQQRLIIQR